MKINSIEWHKENLKNSEEYYKSILNQLEDLESRKVRVYTELYLLRSQIEMAIKEGKTSFNRERYLINRDRRKNGK